MLLFRKVRDLARLALWRMLGPRIQLAAGFARIASDSDWEVANEVFFRREYDEAISTAIAGAGRSGVVRILDLGANVGFFSLRCMDLFLARQESRKLEIIAIEGSRRLWEEIKTRLSDLPPQVNLDLRHGLAGKRTGADLFHSSLTSSCGNTVNRGGRVSSVPFLNSYAAETPYLDLLPLTANWESIDLIKCDIEGSELDFLSSYPELLGKTHTVVIELHPLDCDAEACRALLLSAGFRCEYVVKSFATHVLEVHRRPLWAEKLRSVNPAAT